MALPHVFNGPTGLRLTAVLVFSLFLEAPSYAFEIFPRPVGEYVAQLGDSLSSVAQKYYSDSRLGKLLWSQNPWISPARNSPNPLDSELSPGTKVFFYESKLPRGAADETYTPPTGLPDDVRYLVNKVPFEGIPYDKQYFRYRLSSDPTVPWGYVVSGIERNKERFLERDLIYVRFRPSKKQAVLVGDRFGIYRDRGPLYHPVNADREIGYLTDVVGEVEITSTGHDLITGIILESYVEIERGDKICFYAPRTRQIVPSKTHRMFTGTIVVSASKEANPSTAINLENDIVFVDRGECDGVRDGTLVNVYRPAEPVSDPYFPKWVSTPDAYLGEGIVLKAFEKNSSLLITRSREEIMPGDIIKSCL